MNPNENPDDGRRWCEGCQRWKFLVTHSCPRVPQVGANVSGQVELVHSWKVQVSAKGVHLTLNGKTYELGHSRDAIVFDLERAASGYTVPEH